MLLASRLLRIAIGVVLIYFTPAAEALGRPGPTAAPAQVGVARRTSPSLTVPLPGRVDGTRSTAAR